MGGATFDLSRASGSAWLTSCVPGAALVRRPVICVGLCLFSYGLIWSKDKGRRLSRNDRVQSEHLITILWRLPYGQTRKYLKPTVAAKEMNEKQRTATRKYWANQARRERKSAETKARWDDPEERSKFMAAMSNPERRNRIAAAMRARWADPEERRKLMAGIGNPDSRNGIAAAMRARWADPARRQEMTEQVKAGRMNPSAREKIAAASKARWADETTRAKMIAGIRVAWHRRKQQRDSAE